MFVKITFDPRSVLSQGIGEVVLDLSGSYPPPFQKPST